jgi:hypothetical protein
VRTARAITYCKAADARVIAGWWRCTLLVLAGTSHEVVRYGSACALAGGGGMCAVHQTQAHAPCRDDAASSKVILKLKHRRGGCKTA